VDIDFSCTMRRKSHSARWVVGTLFTATLACLSCVRTASERPVENPTSLSMSSAEGPDTTRYTVLVGGGPVGERLVWMESDGSLGYFASNPFHRTSHLMLDGEGLPVRLAVSGRKDPFQSWEEEFQRKGDLATWSTPVDGGEMRLSGPAYYAAIHPAHDLGVLARALIARSPAVLPLVPRGETRLVPRQERVVSVDGRTRRIRLYGIEGLHLRTRYVWLDEDGATFADESSILEGWEAVFPELKNQVTSAIAENQRAEAERLVPEARERPLVIRNARVFHPESGAVDANATIVVDGNRIVELITDPMRVLPADAEIIDAEGRMVLPGMWDMHAHHDPARYSESYAPLHLAAGVTMTRDMGSNAESLVAFRERVQAGEALGPRILMAGFIEGVGGSRTGIQVGNADEAREAVDHYAELGFVQIKIYNRLPADLVRVVIERADEHGLRVSGHVPWEMTAPQAVEAGLDEIQHIVTVMEGVALDPDEEVDDAEIAARLVALTPASETMRDFIRLLASRGVAVDPTLAFFYAAGTVPPDYLAGDLERFPEPFRRQLLDRSPTRWAGDRWSTILANMSGIVRALHEAGVPVLPGTDAIPGFTLHRELELYVAAGIPPSEVLALATIGAAREMGMDDELGSIAPGMLADLIIVDGDPTLNISEIRRVVTVVKDGRVYDTGAIHRSLGIQPCCP
jgi:hypothetical protein